MANRALFQSLREKLLAGLDELENTVNTDSQTPTVQQLTAEIEDLVSRRHELQMDIERLSTISRTKRPLSVAGTGRAVVVRTETGGVRLTWSSHPTRFLLAAKPGVPHITELINNILLPWAARSGLTYTTLHSEASDCDFTIALGGDGTLLHIAQSSLPPPPVVSFSLGTLGFLTVLSPALMISTLDHFIKHGGMMTVRSRLHVRVSRHASHIAPVPRAALTPTPAVSPSGEPKLSALASPNDPPPAVSPIHTFTACASVPGVDVGDDSDGSCELRSVRTHDAFSSVAHQPTAPPVGAQASATTVTVDERSLENVSAACSVVASGALAAASGPVGVTPPPRTPPPYGVPDMASPFSLNDTPLGSGGFTHVCRPVRLLRDGEVGEWWCMNEVVVDRGYCGQLVALDVDVNGTHLTTVYGDGVIISTPTGSTAYNMSAGGSVVHPCVKALLFTPINPHTLSARPVLFSDRCVFAVRLKSRSRSDAFLTVDGRSCVQLTHRDVVTTRVAGPPYFMSLCAESETSDWMMAIRRLLLWNARRAGTGTAPLPVPTLPLSVGGQPSAAVCPTGDPISQTPEGRDEVLDDCESK